MLRPLIVLEHLYFETNEDNPVTYEELVRVVNAHGFSVTKRTIYKWVKKFINEMDYPIGLKRMERLGACHGVYWKV